MSRWIKLTIFSLATVSLLACGSDDSSKSNGSNNTNNTANNANNTANNANNQQSAPTAVVNECKAACNQQKFFNCYDAPQHAACFRDCEQADQSGIELFVNCVGVEICDSDCATNIAPPDPEPEPTSDDCASACGEIVAEQCIPPVDCGAACAGASAEEKSFFAYCAANRSGCDFPEACEFEGGVEVTPQDECVASCESLGFFDCITGPDVAACSTTCSSLDDPTASSFNSCVQSEGICSDDSCYQLISEGGASADVSGCRQACDDLQFFECVDASEHSQCRTVCETASADAVETFKSCTMGLCDDNSCYLQLLESL